MFVFLTACRNEEGIIPQFLAEFCRMLEEAGIARDSQLYVVDDLSTDRTASILRESKGLEIHVVDAPTNFGNQGAMFYGLARLKINPDDTLITFDCDGEDDVEQIPSVIRMGAAHPGKLVLIERGRRSETLLFKLFFFFYKVLFRFLTRQTIVPNNFMLIPGSFVPTIQRSPLAAVHFAYAILKLRPPYIATIRDRRSRYGGVTSQNMFMLVSHGLVGLMVFFEMVVAKIFMTVFAFAAFATGIFGLAIALPADWASAQRTLIWSAIAACTIAVGLFALLLSAALALLFKLAVFTLIAGGVVPPIGAKPQKGLGAEEQNDAPD